MATTEVVFYAEANKAPALEWLEHQPPKVQDKFDYLVTILEQEGHTLQRPYAAPLGEKVYELRARWLKVHYRLLYFFHGSSAVLAHGCTKEGAVDQADIDRAVARRTRFLKDPAAHTYVGA